MNIVEQKVTIILTQNEAVIAFGDASTSNLDCGRTEKLSFCQRTSSVEELQQLVL